MATKLTDMQLNVLLFIKTFNSEKGYSPSFREIGLNCGQTSTNGVRFVLDKLSSFGYIAYRPNMTRTVHLTQSGVSYCKLIEKS